MSGPKKADVTLKLNRVLAITSRWTQQYWNNQRNYNAQEFRSTENQQSQTQTLLKNNAMQGQANSTFQNGCNLLNESKNLLKQADQFHAEADQKRSSALKTSQEIANDIANKNSYGGFRNEDSRARSCELLANEAARLEQQALNTIMQSTELLKNANVALESVQVLIEQKKEAERQHELKKIETTNHLNSVKKNAENIGIEYLSEWCGNTSDLEKANQLLADAEQKLSSENFEESQSLATKAGEKFYQLHKQAIENQKKYESREVIADAIIQALQELRYDAPDVNYRSEEGTFSEKNHLFGNMTIFAKSPGTIGDMRLSINLDGKVDLEVDNVPEGKEGECRSRITDLQQKVADVADFQVTDWGRAKNYKPQDLPSLPQKEKVKVKEQQRES